MTKIQNKILVTESNQFTFTLILYQGETARILVRNGDIYEGVLKAVSSKVRNDSHCLFYLTS